MVITKRADTAARKTTSLLFLMARMAAMKKVLSPISDTRMTEMDSPESRKNVYIFYKILRFFLLLIEKNKMGEVVKNQGFNFWNK